MNSDEIKSRISPELEEMLLSCTNLPSLPAVALRIIEASKDPDISLHEVSEIIASDPAISVKILKVANSPLYSQRRTLSNLREALTLLGFNAALTIALSFSLLQSLKSDADHEGYWKRSILAASIARILGTHLRVLKLEDLFLASLLQDIGVLVIQCIKDSPYPEKSDKYLKHVERERVEKELLGVDHSVIGAWLLKSWKLPDYLIRSVLYSHSLNFGETEKSTANSYFHYCLSMSGSLADIWLDDNPGELLLSVLNVTRNALDFSKDEFSELITEIDEAIPEISEMFNITLVNKHERENVLFEARELLLERSLNSIKQSEDDRRNIKNISERVEEIEKSSRIDHLTKVYNRQHIDKLLGEEFEESNINRWPLSLAFIDIDDFKLINDTYGHMVGDDLLKLISEFFQKNLRETDILARYGGDEFLLMLPGSTADISSSVLDRLLKKYLEEVALQHKEIEIKASVSIGIATHMDKYEFDNLNQFMAAADEALYKAKHKGKNCIRVFKK